MLAERRPVNPHVHYMKRLKHRYCRCRPLVVTFVYYTCNRVYCMCFGLWPFFSFLSFSFLIGWEFYGPNYLKFKTCAPGPPRPHSSGAVWESRWTSWAVRPNEPSGFRGRKELLNRAPALVTTCPQYVSWHLRTLSINSSSPPRPQGSRRDQEILEEGGGAQVSPEEIMSREVELGWASWTSFASSCPSCSSTVVQRTLS